MKHGNPVKVTTSKLLHVVLVEMLMSNLIRIGGSSKETFATHAKVVYRFFASSQAGFKNKTILHQMCWIPVDAVLEFGMVSIWIGPRHVF